MKTINNILLIALLIFVPSANSQPSITWQKLYDNPIHSDNYCFEVSDALNGNFYLAGHSTISVFPYYGAVNVIKINGFGEIVWNKIYDTIFQTTSSAVTTNDGGCVTVGFASSMLKLDSTGNISWYRKYNQSSIQLWDLLKTNHNEFVATGFQNFPLAKGYVMKSDSAGNLIWNKYLTESTSIFLLSVAPAIDSGYVVAGYTDTPAAVIFKLNPNGDTAWKKFYRVNNGFTKGKVIKRVNSHYILAGNIGLANFIMKLNSQGDSIFTKQYPSPINTAGEIVDFKVINSNKWIISFDLDSGLINRNYCKIMITDSLGSKLHERNFYGKDFVKLLSILPLSNGDILFGGYADYYNIGNDDAYAVRTDSNLNAPPVGIFSEEENVKDFSLKQNYPNPFNPITTLEFEIKFRSKIEIDIYNMEGKRVSSFYNNTLSPGIHKVVWDANNLTSGVYFAKIMLNGNFKSSLKLILIK